MVSVLDGDEGLMVLLCRHPQDDVLGNPVQDRLRHRPSSPTAPAFQSSTGWYSRGENSAGESEIFPTLPRTWARSLTGCAAEGLAGRALLMVRFRLCRRSGFWGEASEGGRSPPPSLLVQVVGDVGHHHILPEEQRALDEEGCLVVQEVLPPVLGHELGDDDGDHVVVAES